MGAHRTFQRLLELAATIAAFGSVYGVYRVSFDQSLPAGPTAAGCVASGLAFWLSSQLKERAPDDNNTWVIFVEQFCFGTGVSLLVHALLTYALLWRRTPFLVVGSSLAAAVLITLLRHMESNRFQQAPRILLAGFDKLSATLIAEVKKPVTGICGTCTVPPPPGVPILGATSDFERIVQETAPTHILISVEAWEKTISPEVLLHCRMNGIRITESAALYEKLLSRVCCERLQPPPERCAELLYERKRRHAGKMQADRDEHQVGEHIERGLRIEEQRELSADHAGNGPGERVAGDSPGIEDEKAAPSLAFCVDRNHSARAESGDEAATHADAVHARGEAEQEEREREHQMTRE